MSVLSSPITIMQDTPSNDKIFKSFTKYTIPETTNQCNGPTIQIRVPVFSHGTLEHFLIFNRRIIDAFTTLRKTKLPLKLAFLKQHLKGTALGRFNHMYDQIDAHLMAENAEWEDAHLDKIFRYLIKGINRYTSLIEIPRHLSCCSKPRSINVADFYKRFIAISAYIMQLSRYFQIAPLNDNQIRDAIYFAMPKSFKICFIRSSQNLELLHHEDLLDYFSNLEDLEGTTFCNTNSQQRQQSHSHTPSSSTGMQHPRRPEPPWQTQHNPPHFHHQRNNSQQRQYWDNSCPQQHPPRSYPQSNMRYHNSPRPNRVTSQHNQMRTQQRSESRPPCPYYHGSGGQRSPHFCSNRPPPGNKQPPRQPFEHRDQVFTYL